MYKMVIGGWVDRAVGPAERMGIVLLFIAKLSSMPPFAAFALL
jgi:hypothetical protein